MKKDMGNMSKRGQLEQSRNQGMMKTDETVLPPFEETWMLSAWEYEAS
jgi:hypothetical protein